MEIITENEKKNMIHRNKASSRMDRTFTQHAFFCFFFCFFLFFYEHDDSMQSSDKAPFAKRRQFVRRAFGKTVWKVSERVELRYLVTMPSGMAHGGRRRGRYRGQQEAAINHSSLVKRRTHLLPGNILVVAHSQAVPCSVRFQECTDPVAEDSHTRTESFDKGTRTAYRCSLVRGNASTSLHVGCTISRQAVVRRRTITTG